jgi:hypothetical protein
MSCALLAGMKSWMVALTWMVAASSCGKTPCQPGRGCQEAGNVAITIPAADALAAAPACGSRFPTFDSQCSRDEDCFVGVHQLNCCGSGRARGISESAADAFEAANARCDGFFPRCGCPTKGDLADDGQFGFDATIRVRCSANVCQTFVANVSDPNPAPPSALTSCLRPTDACTATGTTPLCCPQAGPLAPKVECSTVCSSDADCPSPDRPHCDHPPVAALSGNAQVKGLCMPAGRRCCWFCR